MFVVISTGSQQILNRPFFFFRGWGVKLIFFFCIFGIRGAGFLVIINRPSVATFYINITMNLLNNGDLKLFVLTVIRKLKGMAWMSFGGFSFVINFYFFLIINILFNYFKNFVYLCLIWIVMHVFELSYILKVYWIIVLFYFYLWE